MLTIYLQKGHLPSQKTEALKWSGPCFLYRGPTTDSKMKERFNPELQSQMHMNHRIANVLKVRVRLQGYAEASIGGGRDERGV